MRKIALLLSLFALIFTGARPASAVELHLMAPWSMKGAVDELSDDYVRKHPGIKVARNYGTSSALAKQLESGVLAHIFIAAHPRWADYLKLKNRLSALTVKTLAYNSIVLVGPSTLSGKVSSMEDLLDLERIDIGNADTCRRDYSLEAFRSIGIDKLMAPKISPGKKDGVSCAERGEVDGALVFRSDALAKKAKILFSLPQQTYSRVTYPIAMTDTGASSSDAISFYRFLVSDDAKRVLVKHGFVIN